MWKQNVSIQDVQGNNFNVKLSHVAVRISVVYTDTNQTWNLNAYMMLLRETQENMKGLTDH